MAATHKSQAGSNNPGWKGGISKNLTRYKKLYTARYPEATSAHKAVHEAVKSGKLIKPNQCEDCGVAGKVSAHHEDYSKKLEIQWLCDSCHRAAH